MKTVKMTVLAVSVIASLATAAYAGKVKLAGDFDNTSAEDQRTYLIECSESGEICATIKDGGFHFDNIFGVALECEEPLADIDEAVAKKPGGKAKGCVRCSSGDAAITLFCDETSEFCNDGFIATVKCKGQVEDFEELE